VKHKFAHGDISLPSVWGGFLVQPQQIEFGQGGEHRLHDRVMY
jgi:pyridoxamine 5'-phosphate oxidase